MSGYILPMPDEIVARYLLPGGDYLAVHVKNFTEFSAVYRLSDEALSQLRSLGIEPHESR